MSIYGNKGPCLPSPCPLPSPAAGLGRGLSHPGRPTKLSLASLLGAGLGEDREGEVAACGGGAGYWLWTVGLREGFLDPSSRLVPSGL